MRLKFKNSLGRKKEERVRKGEGERKDHECIPYGR